MAHIVNSFILRLKFTLCPFSLAARNVFSGNIEFHFSDGRILAHFFFSDETALKMSDLSFFNGKASIYLYDTFHRFRQVP